MGDRREPSGRTRSYSRSPEVHRGPVTRAPEGAAPSCAQPSPSSTGCCPWITSRSMKSSGPAHIRAPTKGLWDRSLRCTPYQEQQRLLRPLHAPERRGTRVRRWPQWTTGHSSVLSRISRTSIFTYQWNRTRHGERDATHLGFLEKPSRIAVSPTREDRLPPGCLVMSVAGRCRWGSTGRLARSVLAGGALGLLAYIVFSLLFRLAPDPSPNGLLFLPLGTGLVAAIGVFVGATSPNLRAMGLRLGCCCGGGVLAVGLIVIL